MKTRLSSLLFAAVTLRALLRSLNDMLLEVPALKYRFSAQTGKAA